jgi:hypothetical protein
MEVITGTTETFRGATAGGLSLDFGNFSVTSDNGVLQDPATERYVGRGFLRLPDLNDGTRREYPMVTSWRLDAQGVTEAYGTGELPDGRKFAWGTSNERIVSMVRKRIDGEVVIA